MEQNNFLKQKAREYPRVAALLFMAIGVWLVYFSLLLPVQEVKEGKAEISFSVSGATLGVLLIVIALIFVVTGKRYYEVLSSPLNERSKKAKYIFYAFCFGVGIAANIVIENYLQAKGYTVK